MSQSFLWVKALHIVFIASWFAGLFYLPRLFIYHAAASDALGVDAAGAGHLLDRRLAEEEGS